MTVEGAPVLVSGYQSGGGQALTGGRVVLVAGKCLGLKRTGTKEQLVIWPHGTKVERKPRLALKVDGLQIHLGDEVEVGGSSLRYGLTPKNYFYDKIPQACRG